MNILRGILLTLLLLYSPFLPCVLAAPPAIQRQMEIVNATIEGGNPQTIDPAACYDTASGELLMNMYDTLIFFNGEHMDQYIPQLASQWWIQNITGLGLRNGDLDLYYRYTFKMNSSAHFWNGDPVTAADVEYCVKREMFMDFSGGPQWMFFEPLLNNYGIMGLNATTLDGNLTEQARVSSYIDNAVQSNATHVWFNLAYPGVYAPFMQILSQPWSSIYSKAWAIGLGRSTNWDGVLAHWFTSWNPLTPPFDDPTPVAMGSGPFVFEAWDATLMQWSVIRNHNYSRGWPVDWPAFGSSKPAGYVERYVVTWAYDWNARSTMFLNGDLDICAVPTQYQDSIIGQPGIRCIYPLPSLSVSALLYQFNINPTSPYGPILPPGTFSQSGVPSDFFGNASWGVHVRKAFSYAIDYEAYLDTLGWPVAPDALHPPTAILPVLPHYCPSVSGYYFDLNKTAEELHQVPGLWDTGFTIQLPYNVGSLPDRPQPYEQMSQAINSLNPKFHCSALELGWAPYLAASNAKQLPAFKAGWLADYPDPHNFAYPYYYSQGTYAKIQGYSNPAMDALIDQGISQSDYQEREATYASIQRLAIDDCPSAALDTVLDRHFERSWVCGWYYNPVYPGVYVGNLWKWYYTPHAQLDIVTNAAANLLPYDVNYDGKTNMVDISTAAASFGAVYGPPTSPRWVCRCDFNNDRKIDMRDVGRVASSFGKTSTPWTPPP